MRYQPVARKGERGFALLFVFALAGIAALTLYNELPRAVFESQRSKEDLLVSRGQEYQRGIQLYYRKYRKYPTTIEELEKSNGIRFLRRRFVDPFSGKDDWRLVHIANGQFTDSKVVKPQQPAQSNGFGSLSSSTTTAEQVKEDPNDPALKRRASDTSAAEIGGNGTGAPAAPADPNALPTGAPPAPFPGRTQTDPANTNNPYPPQNYTPGGVGSTGSSGGVGGVGSVGAGLPNTSYPSAGINSQTGGVNGMPIQPQIPNYNQAQGGQRPLTNEQLTPALDVIQRLLTQPRNPPPGISTGNGIGGNTGGFNSTTPMTNPGGSFTASGPGLTGGGGGNGNTGIAGVASKHEGKGIKLINERERIEEWEFIYDSAKDKGGRPNANTQSQQMQNGINPAGGFPSNTGGFGGQQGGGFGGGGMNGGGRPQGGFGGQQQQPPFGGRNRSN